MKYLQSIEDVWRRSMLNAGWLFYDRVRVIQKVMQILCPDYKLDRCALAEQTFNIMAEIHTSNSSIVLQAKA